MFVFLLLVLLALNVPRSCHEITQFKYLFCLSVLLVIVNGLYFQTPDADHPDHPVPITQYTLLHFLMGVWMAYFFSHLTTAQFMFGHLGFEYIENSMLNTYVGPFQEKGILWKCILQLQYYTELNYTWKEGTDFDSACNSIMDTVFASLGFYLYQKCLSR